MYQNVFIYITFLEAYNINLTVCCNPSLCFRENVFSVIYSTCNFKVKESSRHHTLLCNLDKI